MPGLRQPAWNATTGVSVNASPLITTTYTVTGTGSNGCTATATAVVNKGTPITNVVASASPQSFCAPGGNSTLNVTATVNSTLLQLQRPTAALLFSPV